MNMQARKTIAPLVIILIGGALILGAAILLILGSGFSHEDASSTPQGITNSEIVRARLDEAKAAFDSGEATFVDVRSRAAFDEDHIPGAISIPLDELEIRLDELDPSDWILLYCT